MGVKAACLPQLLPPVEMCHTYANKGEGKREGRPERDGVWLNRGASQAAD